MCVQDVRIGRGTKESTRLVVPTGSAIILCNPDASRVRIAVALRDYTETFQKTYGAGGDLIDIVYYNYAIIGPKTRDSGVPVIAPLITLTAGMPYAIMRVEEYGVALLGTLYYQIFTENTQDGNILASVGITEFSLVQSLEQTV